MEIRLRAMELEDLDILYHIENDRSLWNISAANVPYSRYALYNYIADAKNDIYVGGQPRMMIRNHKQEIIGVIDLVSLDPKHQRVETGIIIMKPFRQEGRAQAAIPVLIDYTRNGSYLEQIYVVVDIDNEVSVRRLPFTGFTDSNMPKEWLCCDEQYEDARIMQLFIQKA